MERGQIKEKILLTFFLIVSIFALFIFFTKVHPLMIFDSDDWYLITFARKAVPIWGAWNPSKVFPEILMPTCASFARYVIYPFTGDYIDSMTLVFGGVASIFIGVYLYFFIKYIYKNFKINITQIIFLAAIFLLLHFLIFRAEERNNYYLFYSAGVVSYYNYIIPTLLNIIFLLFFEVCPVSKYKSNPIFCGLVLLGVYLAIFSNLFSSYILAIYAAVNILMSLFKIRGLKNLTFWGLFKQNIINIYIIVLWIVSAIFELSGGRANDFNDKSYISNIKQTISILGGITFNKFFVAFTITIFLIAFLIIIKKRDRIFLEKITQMALMGILSFVYLILLSAKTSPGYIFRRDVLFGVFFFLFMIMFICLSYIIKEIEPIAVLLPMIVCLCFYEINVNDRTFLELNAGGFDSETCYKINEFIIEQFLEADKNGKTEMILYLPNNPYDENNWPWGKGYDRFGNTLYIHGIISKKMDVTMVPDVKVNEILNIYQ